MKHTFIIALALAALSFSVASCSDDDTATHAISPLSGYYHVEEMVSDIPVDLDGDGNAQTDMMAEIHEFFDIQHDLELRQNSNGYKAVDFYLPHPNLIYPGEPYFYVAYTRSAFAIQYEYAPASQQITLIKEASPQYYQTWGDVQSVESIGNGRLKCVLVKQYYDYQVSALRNITVTATYSKSN